MKPVHQKKLLGRLLLRNKGSKRLWAALLALCIGTTLLLFAVMVWSNFQALLEGKENNDSLGSTFMTVSKKVTNEKMGNAKLTLFSENEIEALRSAPQVQDVGVLVSNRFPVYAALNSSFGFATDMFLEAVPDRFLDNKPVDWYWQPGNTQVPIIMSSEFLNLYNYGFALSQGLPQLSQSSIQSLAFDLKVGYGDKQEMYTAHVVGFSDRISSVLVPESFIRTGNKVFANDTAIKPSRLIVKAKDPSDKAFVSYLQEREYTTNAEQLRWNKLRSVVEVVTSATGILAILLMSIGTLVFILFIELTIARAQQSLKLLLELGYAPAYLSMFMIRRFVPLIGIAILVAVGIAWYVQYTASQYVGGMGLQISGVPGMYVWLALAVSVVILLALVSNAIIRSIRNS